MKWDFDKQHKNFTFALIFTTGANSIRWRYDLTEWETGGLESRIQWFDSIKIERRRVTSSYHGSTISG